MAIFWEFSPSSDLPSNRGLACLGYAKMFSVSSGRRVTRGQLTRAEMYVVTMPEPSMAGDQMKQMTRSYVNYLREVLLNACPQAREKAVGVPSKPGRVRRHVG